MHGLSAALSVVITSVAMASVQGQLALIVALIVALLALVSTSAN